MEYIKSWFFFLWRVIQSKRLLLVTICNQLLHRWNSVTKYEVHTINFHTFFVWALLLIVHTWNSSTLWSNLPQLQCTCFTVQTTSARTHGSPLVWVCQWPSSRPLSSPQLSRNDSVWAQGITKSHREQGLDYREGEGLSWCPSWSNCLWQGWICELVYCSGGNATDPIWRVLAFSDGISTWTPLKPQHSNPKPKVWKHIEGNMYISKNTGVCKNRRTLLF